jgi:hypothetical protein
MSRRLVPFLTFAVLGALSLAAITVSVRTDKVAHITPPKSHHPSKTNPYGAPEYGFGGYTLDRLTSEIGAQWRVPAIATESSEGNATTWIAVQNEERQFIQLGTVENKNNGVAMYGIFWSDVTVGFHPQQLLEVNAGDLIRFKMVQVPRGWRLSFDDLTDNTPETITVPYAAGSSFSSGQWIQEDPTIGGLSTHLPYPSIAPTTFEDMTLNTSKPSFDFAESQALSTVGGVYMVPSKVTGDRFTFTEATGPARQYLGDVFAFDAALYPFQVDLFYNRSPSRDVRRQMVSTLATLQSNLTTQTWPASMARAVKSDDKEITLYLKLYRSFTLAPKPLSDVEVARLESINHHNSSIVNNFRRQLGLPPVD